MENHTTSSHSEVFGLQGQSAPSKTGGHGPGSGVIGTSGHAGSHNAVSDGGSNAVREENKSDSIAGAGGSMLKPSLGSAKRGDQS